MVSGGDRPDALSIAEAVLARALDAGASEAEVLVMSEDQALTRFANSEIHQNVAETSASVNLRFALGRRIATASTGRPGDCRGVTHMSEFTKTVEIR